MDSTKRGTNIQKYRNLSKLKASPFRTCALLQAKSHTAVPRLTYEDNETVMAVKVTLHGEERAQCSHGFSKHKCETC